MILAIPLSSRHHPPRPDTRIDLSLIFQALHMFRRSWASVVTPAVLSESHLLPYTVPWPSPQRAFVAVQFSAALATWLPAFRVRPIALPVRATSHYAEDQALLAGGTSVPSRGNFPSRSCRFSLYFLRANCAIGPANEKTEPLTFSSIQGIQSPNGE
jgi:hypothetical protein